MPAQRELIEPHKGDKRYVRRDERGRFRESVSVGRAASPDLRVAAEHDAPRRQGDQGDRPNLA